MYVSVYIVSTRCFLSCLGETGGISKAAMPEYDGSKSHGQHRCIFSLELLDLAFFYLDIILFLGLLEMGATRIGSVTIICSAEAVRS